MTIKEILEKSNLDKTEAEILLAFVLKKDRSFLLGFPDFILTINQEKLFQSFAARRARHEPLPYILGYREFYGYIFLVNKNVLIPRPETESLVEKVLKFAKDKQGAPLTIADIGTGSGAIAITLKLKEPTLKVVAADISKKALEVARKNAKLHRLTKEIEFVESDLLSNVKNNLDVIVANLPYIPEKNYQKLPAEIRDFEPKIALNSFNSKDFYYSRLFEQAKTKLKKAGVIFYEIDGEIFSITKEELLTLE